LKSSNKNLQGFGEKVKLSGGQYLTGQDVSSPMQDAQPTIIKRLDGVCDVEVEGGVLPEDEKRMFFSFETVLLIYKKNDEQA